MAIDAWLLEQHRLGHGPPALRFYTWSPPAISLGYHQNQWPAHWETLTWHQQSLDLVRRPSGGRAVLHQGDLTYAAIVSGLSGNRREVYQSLCQFLIEGWRSLGMDLHYGQAGRGYIHNPNCFGTATAADLVTADGFKLIGSAQLRRGTAILQHGSMRLMPDADLFRRVFSTDLGASTVLSSTVLSAKMSHPTLSERVPLVVEALLSAARQCLAVHLDSQPLTPDEWQAIQVHSASYRVQIEPMGNFL